MYPTRHAVQAEIKKLQTITLPMAEEEFDRLRAFLAAHAKLEPRKLDIAKARAAAASQQKNLNRTLEQNLLRQKPLERQHQEAADELNRLKNPPPVAPLETYFFTEDVSAALRAAYPNVSPDLLKIINGLHSELKAAFHYTQAVPARLRALKVYVYNLQQNQRTVDKEIAKLETTLRNMGPTWKRHDEVAAQIQSLRGTGLPALTAEIGKLNDYWAALDAAETPPAERAKILQEKETAFAKLDQSWRQSTTEAANLQGQLKALENEINTPDTEKLLQVKTAHLTVKDIVNGKLGSYKAELAQKDHFPLLEEIVQRFLNEPKRYPLWLQYMVIHFSGMRYQSAHGSWADPKDLLANLRTAALEKDFKQLDDVSKDAILEQKLAAYGIGEPAPAGDDPSLPTPPLAQATAPRWKEKLTRHLRALQNPSAYHRRKALFDLLMDEENYEVEHLTGEEVKEALEAMKDTLPAWMWKEIIKVTDLKVQYVEDANWENLDAKEQAEKSDARWQEYRLMVSKWKEASTTAWREEHAQSNQLIVTRAVCNETAEHIQHIRGNSPPGGLTAKPKWYLGLENAGAGKPVPPGDKRPHFIIPRTAEDFTVGASILWLRFVNDYPNPWRIAPPLTLKSGDGLLPAQFFGGGAKEGGWVYSLGKEISRTRTVYDGKKKAGQEQQWLRWIHEATVAEVAETAEGPVILTFETALPNEDKRLSSIGVFKHYLHNIVYKISGEWFNAAFVGYTPEGDIPSADLEFMLDWNKILLREVSPPH